MKNIKKNVKEYLVDSLRDSITEAATEAIKESISDLNTILNDSIHMRVWLDTVWVSCRLSDIAGAERNLLKMAKEHLNYMGVEDASRMILAAKAFEEVAKMYRKKAARISP